MTILTQVIIGILDLWNASTYLSIPQKFCRKAAIRPIVRKIRYCQDITKQESIKVITKLPNSEQSYKGKVKTHNYINRQNQSTTGKL